MIQEDAGFRSSPTDEASWFQDLANFTRSQFSLQGLAPPSIGVSKPDAPVTDANSFLDTMRGWFAQQRAIQGGAASDAIDTPVSDTYRERRYQFLSREEGIRGFAYDDKTGQQLAPGQRPQGFATVGMGFNLDDPSSRTRFQTALPGVDFDGVREGRVKLNDAQVQQLFDRDVQQFEGMVSKALAGVDLPEHQRLALVSLAYNRPASLEPVAEALRNGDKGGALAALLSQPGPGTRRLREAAMFAGMVDAPQALGALAKVPRADVDNVDSRLQAILSEAGSQLPDGYRVVVTSGFRPGSRVAGTGGVSHHAHGNALDVQIVGPQGPIPNEGEDTTGLYTQLVKAALAVQRSKHPDLNGQLAWGGFFTTGPNNGPKDLMHFDLGGDRGRYGRLASLL